MRELDDYRRLVDEYLDELPVAAEVTGGLAEAMHYLLLAGGKRIRPVVCLATGESAGADVHELLPAAAAVELVHTFSLVHDDLPALDDDAVRRGRPSTHVRFGEAVAILAGDALLTEAFRLALSYRTTSVAGELAHATLGMIGGQYLDVTDGTGDVATRHRLKTGRLFGAAVGCALHVAGVDDAEQAPWRAFSDELGFLFQVVDDLEDEDGYVGELGEAGARQLAHESAARAHARLAEIPADTSALADVVAELAARAR